MNTFLGSQVIIFCYHVPVQIRFSVCSCPDQVFCVFLSRSGFHHVLGSCPDQVVGLLCSCPDQVFFIMFLSRPSGHSVTVFLSTTDDHSVMFLSTSGGHSVMFCPCKRWSCCHFCCYLDQMFIVTVTFNSSGPEGRPGMSDVFLLSGISGLSFDSPFLSPLLFFLHNPLALSVLSYFY